MFGELKWVLYLDSDCVLHIPQGSINAWEIVKPQKYFDPKKGCYVIAFARHAYKLMCVL